MALGASDRRCIGGGAVLPPPKPEAEMADPHSGGAFSAAAFSSSAFLAASISGVSLAFSALSRSLFIALTTTNIENAMMMKSMMV